ncbi:hypothetical protein [Oceanirhabdus sp. W0125-5]|uniref:hypothetical protein n=1 Tax=Oceanirhabdus sp. W0125-5 TaxID=2999116 RepID=UPI0022F343E7|nr:hypothetical protein [Oceanirhabdus sp. W0125-5]WBW96475.1 hypothetical protein OW730_22685 [Oceanirhabdus sp. W0125-5]
MKKYLTVLIIVLIVSIALLGCTNNNKESEETSKNEIITISEKSTQNHTKVDNKTKNNTNNLNENAQKLEHKDKFLKSKEGHDFQVVSWKFTKAYLSGDVSAMKSYLINPENKDNYYNTENKFDDVEFLILKLDPNDIKEDRIIAEYEFCLKNTDYYQYLNLEMKKINGEWKVKFYGLQM